MRIFLFLALPQIQQNEIIDDPIDFSLSFQGIENFHLCAVSLETFEESEQTIGLSREENDRKCVFFMNHDFRLEDSIFEKYNKMSYKELREECVRYGIACSGLRSDYVKKLVSYVLSKHVLLCS